jgi:coenzyme F420 hydrogenase subunit beta
VPPEKLHWTHLYDEVVTSGLCTGCAACIVACPHDVLGYNESYKPFHLEEEGGPAGCVHGDKGCTLCTRACPRFRDWETDADTFLFGRPRLADEVIGITRKILLTRATDGGVLEKGQDGGSCSAILIWCLEKGIIDGALVSFVDGNGSSWKVRSGVARTRDEILAGAGSRYTYSANTLAYKDAVEAGLEKLALVGMSCQASAPPMMATRGVRKVSRRIVLNLGLLCSKTFEERIFEELLEAKYGLARAEIAKMNIKGRLQLWTHSGDYVEVPLKECHEFTRQGCKMCPDFSAEHADISLGGLGQTAGWTLTIVRTEKGEEIIDGMIADGSLESKSADSDPDTLALLRKLSLKQRKRWPISDAQPAMVGET